MRIVSLGGSGERGRTAFLVESSMKIVLDYGVKRKITGKTEEIYPLKIEETVDLLFLSHAHQDHTGAVPLLNFKRLMCSAPTLSFLKRYVSAWFETARRYGLVVGWKRYEDFPSRSFEIFSEDRLGDMNFKTGKSGHLIGSLWMKMETSDGSILYTGDVNLDSPMYKVDPLERADVLIVDSAYGTKHVPRREELLDIIDSLKGRVVLPLPPVGRSQEILLSLLGEEIEPVFVDGKIVDTFEILKEYPDWLKLDLEDIFEKVWDLNTEFPKEFPPGVYLTTDGMITGGSSLRIYEILKDDADAHFVLTGHQEEGTLGWRLLKSGDERAVRFTWKVHPDFEELVRIIDSVKPRMTILFHSTEEEARKTIAKLRELGLRARVLKTGEEIDIGREWA